MPDVLDRIAAPEWLARTTADYAQRGYSYAQEVEISSGADWWLEGSSTKTAAGLRVNGQAALTYAAFWRGINLISSAVAGLPLNVLQRMEAGKVKYRAHPAFALLRHRPNRYLSAHAFKQTLQAHALTEGGGYAYIVRAGSRPVELLILSPTATTPQMVDGVLWYRTRLPDGALDWLPAEDVLHIHGLGFDGIRGYSVVSYAAETLGLGLALRDFGARFFQNNARPNGWIEHPGHPSNEAVNSIRESWNQKHGGVENAHRVAILREGFKFHELAINAKDAQLIETRKFELIDIANVLGIPPYLLGGDEGGQSYASLEQKSQDFLDYSLNPWLIPWEEECAAKLLTSAELSDDSALVEFERAALLRVDFKTQIETLVTQVNNGLLNRDQACAILNLPPLPNGAGQVYVGPLQLGPVGQAEDDKRAAAVLEARKTVLSMLFGAEGPGRAALFNAVDVRAILADGGIPLRPGVPEPYLPIVVNEGPVVRDGVVRNEAGDIIGGDLPIAVPPAVLESNEWGESARMGVVRETLERMARRLATQAERANKRGPEQFAKWLDTGIASQCSIIAEALQLPVRALLDIDNAAGTVRTADLAAAFMADCVGEMRVAPDDLAGACLSAVPRMLAGLARS